MPPPTPKGKRTAPRWSSDDVTAGTDHAQSAATPTTPAASGTRPVAVADADSEPVAATSAHWLECRHRSTSSLAAERRRGHRR